MGKEEMATKSVDENIVYRKVFRFLVVIETIKGLFSRNDDGFTKYTYFGGFDNKSVSIDDFSLKVMHVDYVLNAFICKIIFRRWYSYAFGRTMNAVPHIKD